MRKFGLVLAGPVLALSALALGTPANAAGCGGYVNLAVWGCAPWDNNPPKKGVTPGYGTAKPAPVIRAPVEDKGRLLRSGDLIPANKAPVITHDGGSRPGSGIMNPANTSSSFRR